MGEEERKDARDPARIGEGDKAVFGRSTEGADRRNLEVGRKVRGDSEGPSGEAWKELWQHQRLVSHHGERDKGNQEG